MHRLTAKERLTYCLAFGTLSQSESAPFIQGKKKIEVREDTTLAYLMEERF